jgi:hypothetical protein
MDSTSGPRGRGPAAKAALLTHLLEAVSGTVRLRMGPAKTPCGYGWDPFETTRGHRSWPSSWRGGPHETAGNIS